MTSGSLALFDLDALFESDEPEKLDLDDLLGLDSECVWEKGTMLIFMPEAKDTVEKDGWICGVWGITAATGLRYHGETAPYTHTGRALHHLPTGMRAANTRTIKQAKCMAEGLRSLLPFLEREGGSDPSGILLRTSYGETPPGGPKSRFAKALIKERHEIGAQMTATTSLRAKIVNLYRKCTSG